MMNDVEVSEDWRERERGGVGRLHSLIIMVLTFDQCRMTKMQIY